MARVLVPLPDTDFDVTEVAAPWHVLTGAGHEVVFATEHGTTPAADPRLLTGVIFGQLGAADAPKQQYAAMTGTPGFRAPLHWSAVSVADYDALLLPGGHAPGMRQYLGSAELQRRVGEFWALDRPVGAICHGVLVLARAGVLGATRTTCLTKAMERGAYLLTSWKLGRYYRTYPAYVEDEVVASLDDRAQFERGPLATQPFVVEDGRYVSGRWPGDANLFAQRFEALLSAGPRPQ